MLGRSPADPLVLMIARGPAGYRFAVKALQHAVPDARVERGESQDVIEPDTWIIPLWLSGRLRGSDRPIETVLQATLTLSAGAVSHADVALDQQLVPLLREARLRD